MRRQVDELYSFMQDAKKIQIFCARTIDLRIYTSAFVSSGRAATQWTVSAISLQLNMSLLDWKYRSTANVSAISPQGSMNLSDWFRFFLSQLDAACTSTLTISYTVMQMYL
ncbi:hypothetical protein AVEN_14792-1 [Araneus ventricosus]|uniref:Uncharacterized protein n=1 Tax=Araneus ventricosus TaxID=182803 RepID=A0A4Y2FIM7_ARAVE|nr:hypothetical protein AVEN_14792-1 [Araneus ventricosus]